MIIIDVGSSSVKVYASQNGQVKLLQTQTLLLKSDFATAKANLFKLVQKIQKTFLQEEIRVYGTALFRKLKPEVQQLFLAEFKSKTNLEFTIISQDQESQFLQQALIHKYTGTDPVLLINIGGGSTELVVVQNKQAVERKNIDLGVVALLKQFPNINEPISGVTLPGVKQFVFHKLPTLDHQVKIAFYSGGELRYMRLANYELRPNDLFTDPEHPSLINFSDFSARNAEIFNQVRLEELEKLMPEDPDWMHGARACSAFAETLCEKYQIKTIIPSNSNLINGIGV